MTLPNFYMIGAAKSGTTSLNEYIDQHPQVYMSPIKEPHFFVLEGTDIDFHGPGDVRALDPMYVSTLDDYKNLFAGVKDEIAIGEGTTQYLYYPEVADKIHALTPDAKIIAFLRHPVDRAYSSFTHLTRDGRETHEDFERALQDEPQRIADKWAPLWHYAAAGYYHDNLKHYMDIFGEAQVKVFLFDDLKKDVGALLKAIFAFLDVDDTFEPDTSIRYNVSGVPKNRTLQSVQDLLLTPNNPIKEMIKPLLPQKFRHRMLHKVVDHMRKVNYEKRPLDPALRNRLTENYRDDILKTQDLIRRDLSHWLKPKPEVSTPTE